MPVVSVGVPTGSVLLRVVRVVLLVGGLTAMAVAFIGLVDEQLAVVGAAPWSYVGVIGMVATLLALGSPRQS